MSDLDTRHIRDRIIRSGFTLEPDTECSSVGDFLGTQPESRQWIESVPAWSWALFAVAGGLMLRGSR